MTSFHSECVFLVEHEVFPQDLNIFSVVENYSDHPFRVQFAAEKHHVVVGKDINLGIILELDESFGVVQVAGWGVVLDVSVHARHQVFQVLGIC